MATLGWWSRQRAGSTPREPHLHPETVVGAWLLARIERDDTLAQQLLGRLNRGTPGWNDDEPAVISSAAEIALKAEFSSSIDEGQIREYTSRIVASIAPVDDRGLSERVDFRKLAADRLEGRAPDAGLGAGDIFMSNVILVTQCCRDLGLARDAVAAIIVEAEQVAAERGFRPPVL